MLRSTFLLTILALSCARQEAPDPGRTGPDARRPREGSPLRATNPTCVAPSRPTGAGPVQLVPAFGAVRFTKPVAMVASPLDPERFFIVEQDGLVRTLRRTDATPTTALDFRTHVDAGPEEGGLLGLAFHPDAATTGVVFLSYTARENGELVSRITRMNLTTDGGHIDDSEESLVLRVPQPFDNHHGGHIAFGPDGRLYIGLGDGGGAGDPQNSAQDLSKLQGKILRLDVDAARPYATEDNPFVGIDGARPEIWAYGLRNPWKFSFDRLTGALFAGDVGQNAKEEIDLVVAGGNYGWSRMEGTDCYRGAAACPDPGYLMPIAEYDHTLGNSVTGGYVYRGGEVAGLNGTYVFGDFVSGAVWGLARTGESGGWVRQTLLDASEKNISSFAEDAAGELYVLGYTDGSVSRVAPAATGPVIALPARLSQTGCMNPRSPWVPVPGLVAYDVNAPLWSDGASKERWLAVPDGMQVIAKADGTLELPVGGVLVKQFRQGGRLVETRFEVRYADGGFGFYTYRWNEAQTDADLVEDAASIDLGGGATWRIPARGECLECHTEPAQHTLGFRVAQIDRNFAGGSENQLAALAAAGYLTTAGVSLDAFPALPDPFGAAPVADRARAYLDGNCSGCHRPGGTGRGGLDLRSSTPFAAQGLCGTLPATDDLGLSSPLVLAPGQPDRSVLLARVSRRGGQQMPPLARDIVHGDAVNLLTQWIQDISSCPTDIRRTVVLILKETQPGQDLVLRGGIDHARALALGKTCTDANYACAVPITRRPIEAAPGDNYLDWYGREVSQHATGSPLVWTTNAWDPRWGPARSVEVDGYGESPLNTFGAHYWMLDVDMDCSRTLGGAFELKALVTGPGGGWEPDIHQDGVPHATKNHVAQCGMLNVFRWGEDSSKVEVLR